ncbi:unnamed protein product [Linum tenue]|uniref:Uncharacterized protein n=1 Tax=Linum tenue TaxID=586396 RepID=A0AAV0HW24_9ROSI|nr:unnamed protein product [Linum tenue]
MWFTFQASQDKKSLDVGANLFIGNLDPVGLFVRFLNCRECGPRQPIPQAGGHPVDLPSHAPAVHLRCPYNNRYLMVVPQREHLVIAGETEMRDDPNDQTSTLFYPSFPSSTDNLEYFRYFPYESYDETMARKDEEIKAITESLEEFKGSNGESLSPEELIGQLRERIAEQNRELEELYDQIGGRPS